MSDSQSMRLPELTKEDFKNMAKQREKAKRDQNAKQAKTSATFGEPTMPSSVSFPAPVKVASEDADTGRIMGVLGRFEDFSNIMKQCRYTDVVGVERQPATPRPGKSVDRQFFKSSSASTNSNYQSSSSRPNKPSAHGHNSATNSKSDVKYNKPVHTLSSADGKAKNVSSSYGSKTESSSNRTSSSDRSSLQNANSLRKPDQKPESSIANDHKLVTSDQSKSDRHQNLSQSAKKDLVSQSVKHPPIRNREPVLQSINNELIGQSKPEIHQSGTSNQKSSTSKVVAKNSENKDGKQPSDSRTVLKEKEENRNGDVVNGAKLKNRPKLHIPENVEEMLKEFQVPQPLTGIQTPFKESQFPFSDKIQDRRDLNVVAKSSKDLMKSLPDVGASSDEPVKTTVPVENHDTSSSSSDSSSSESEDDDSSCADEQDDGGFDLDGIIERGQHEEKSEPLKPSVTTSQSTGEKREHKSRTFIAEKVPPLGTDTTAKTSEDTESQGMGQSCSSSESSSSGSESESDNGSDSESDKDVSDDEPHQRTPQGTPNNADNLGTSPSPASKKWNLGAFLQQPQKLINMASKPPSCEAPASNKSDPDHFEEDTMKRGSDLISDENPPSVDQDVLSKPMSADEFSPPAPIEPKQILSPIKSPLAPPIKSPLPAVISPLQYHTPKAAEKVLTPSKYANDLSNHTKTVERVKHKDCNNLPSKPGMDVTNSKGRRPRKKKLNIVSVERIDSSDSESESEIDVVNRSSDSALSSPQKPLPTNLKLSQKYTPLDNSLCSVKRKESKRDKLLKEKDSVKLKREIASSNFPSKDCDKKKVTSRVCARSFTDPIDDMLHSFPDEKPLSPIRSVTNMHKINSMEEDLIRAGLAVSTKNPIPVDGNLSCVKGKPSVLVKIDLNLLDSVLCVDRHSPNFLKPKEHLSGKHHKKLTSAKYSSPSDIRSKKVHIDTSKDKISKSTASKLSANSIPDIDLSDKKYVPEKESISNLNVTKKQIPKSHESQDVPDFDALPVREPVKSDNLSDNVSDSDSDASGSEIEDSKHAESVHDSLSTSNHSSFSQSPLEKKKRKLNTTRDDDSKRRKTLSKSPANTPASDIVKEVQPVEISVKRERHGSASSQHSTLSNVSQRSSHSQRSSQGHRSQKRARTLEDVGQGLRPASGAISRPHDRSKSTAVVTPVVKYETLDTSSQNGFVVHNPPFYRSMLSDKEEEQRLLSADDYHRKAKKYKYQADDMDPGLTKYVLYLESVLCFIQCGYAMEKDHMITEASNMYKDTYKFVSHQLHQFRMYHDSEASDKAHKLTVLCLRIQSLVYLKLYMLKKNETVKLKRILEDHNNKSVKSSSQPKAPSAPSPHQPSWNRSTGTPSPMSPTPSPANSVCSVGSVGSDVTPSKISNGSSGQGQIAPPGSVIVPQRIHSITQKYFSNTCYLIQAHELWDQAASNITSDNREFFAQLDLDCGPLTLHSSLLHLVRYVKQAISQLNL
ncbi:AF4/FMR2 family member 4-like isoform X2 [Mercenaria mercenaria]|uniref:AF4/FMR2 family member 4-like isoform X2 n=1 Tax=Mercenaria mercenaria TaxID=6596 RepID=UPI00234F7923|nr:AF4/FMR2 family member 4-like isoform X2 [Mercenaria mercenaria]